MNVCDCAFAFYFKENIVQVPQQDIVTDRNVMQSKTLYKDPILILAVLVDEMQFDVRHEYMQLATRQGRSTQTYLVLLDDPRKVHYYRRLLAQKALSGYPDELVFTHLLKRALSIGAVDLLAITPAPAAPPPSSDLLECAKELTLRLTTEQLWALLQTKLNASVVMENHSEFVDAGNFFTTLFYCNRTKVVDAGVFALTLQGTQQLSMVCLLADIAMTEDYSGAYY